MLSRAYGESIYSLAVHWGAKLGKWRRPPSMISSPARRIMDL